MKRLVIVALLTTAALGLNSAARAGSVLSYWGGHIPQKYELTHWGTWLPACNQDYLAPSPCQDVDTLIPISEPPIQIVKPFDRRRFARSPGAD